ncbi:MAG: carbon-nitrogen hydrolase family protein [Coriobacteriaceae bacterium]|jgi:nitrilase/aliphatic nitrilase|nr:carbon-nitrogen hydrolase family protein [Coriobacteriaceae bacterium]
MSGDTYPKARVASVQAAPVFLDREATIEKVARLTAEAKQGGADLVVFPESFIPTYPVWCLLLAPIDQHPFFQRLFENSVMVPSPAFSSLQEIARANDLFLSIGVTEKSDYSLGAMWNTNILIDPEGNLVNKHRKIVPTWAEKLVWASGDGSSLRVDDTAIGRIGALICGENTNTLARYSLVSQGEQIHIATYPPCWPIKRGMNSTGGGYNTADITRIRAAAHCFEGKLFTIASSGVLAQDAIDQLCEGHEDLRPFLENVTPAASMIVGPDGQLVAGPITEEGIVYADIDITTEIHLKGVHDIVGSYQRFDIFQVYINRSVQAPAAFYTNERIAMAPSAPGKENLPVAAEEASD